MARAKKPSESQQSMRQIAVAVAIALLAGGTAPWWWGDVGAALRGMRGSVEKKTQSLRVRAYIDARSQIALESNSARWCNLDGGAVPGRWEANDRPTVINDVEYRPNWSFSRGNGCSSPFGPIATTPPSNAQNLELNVVAGRGAVRIVDIAPVTIEFVDEEPGADTYEVELRWSL